LAATAVPPAGSCELSLVDAEGNWVQMMNTLQSGGVPGEVVGGGPMMGSHTDTSLNSTLSGGVTGGGGVRSPLGNTIVCKDGKPVWSLGSPGNVYCTVPQVLLNRLSYGMDPYEAEDAPRMLPITDDYKLAVESRVSPQAASGLARLGVLLDPLPKY